MPNAIKENLQDLLARAGFKSPHVAGKNFMFVPDDHPDEPVYGIVKGFEPYGGNGVTFLYVTLPVLKAETLKYFVLGEKSWMARVVPNNVELSPTRPGTLTIVD